MATRKITTMELQMTGRSAQQFIQMMAQEAEKARKKMGELTTQLNEVRKSSAYKNDDAATLKRAVALEKEIALLKEQASMYEAASKSTVRNINQMANAMDSLSKMSLKQVKQALKEADLMLMNLGKDFEKDQAVLAKRGQLVKELEARAKSLSKGVLQPVEQARQALQNFGKSVGDIKNLSTVMSAQLPVFEKMSGGMNKWKQTVALTDKGYLTFGEDYLKVSTQIRQQLSMTDKASEQYKRLSAAFKSFGSQTISGDITKQMRAGLEAALDVMGEGNKRAKAFTSAIYNINNAGQTIEATFGKIRGGNLFSKMNKELEDMVSRLWKMRAAGQSGTDPFLNLLNSAKLLRTGIESMSKGFIAKDMFPGIAQAERELQGFRQQLDAMRNAGTTSGAAFDELTAKIKLYEDNILKMKSGAVIEGTFSTLRKAMKEQETVIEANNKRYTEWKTLLADINSGAFPVEKVGQLTRALVEQSFMVQKDKDQWQAYSEVLGQVMSRSMTPESLRSIIDSLKAQLPALEENSARWREVNQLITDLTAREKMLTQAMGADMQNMSALSVPALEAIRRELRGIISDGSASRDVLADAMHRMGAVTNELIAKYSRVVQNPVGFSSAMVNGAMAGLKQIGGELDREDNRLVQINALLQEGQRLMTQMGQGDAFARLNQSLRGIQPQFTSLYQSLEQNNVTLAEKMEKSAAKVDELRNRLALAKQAEQQLVQERINAEASGGAQGLQEFNDSAQGKALRTLQGYQTASGEQITGTIQRLESALSQANASVERFSGTIEHNKSRLDEMRTAYNGVASTANMTDKELKQQEQIWREQCELLKNAKDKTDEYATAQKNLAAVQAQQKTNAMSNLGLTANGTSFDVGTTGMLAQLNDQSFPKTIEWLNKLKQEVEAFKTKFVTTPEGAQMLNQQLEIANTKLQALGATAASTGQQNLFTLQESSQKMKEILANMAARKHPFVGDSGEIEKMNASLKKLRENLIKDGKSTAEVDRAIRGMKGALDTSKVSMDDFKKILAKPSKYDDLEKIQHVLDVIRARAKAAGYATAEQANQMRQLDKRAKELNQSFGYHASMLEQAASRLKSYVMIYMGFNAMMMKARQAIQSNLELTDSISNIQKVSNATETEVQRLTNAIQRLDARTKNSELMQIAYQGGKMGVAYNGGMQAMEQFVESANKLNSALGEDFGGAEAVGKLTKLTQTMGVAARDCHNLNEALERTGSAILTLGNNTTANYAYINGFATRLGGIAKAADISMPDLLAIGATMDVMGLQAEMSATAMTKFIATLSKKPDNLAKSIKLTGDGLERFNAAIKGGDTMGAIQEVFRHLHDGNVDLKDMANVLKDMVGGGNNTRALQVLTAMSKNYETLKANVDMANESFLDGTAIQKEYDIMNENAAAHAARMGNAIGEIFTNTGSAKAFATLMKGLADSFEWLENHIPTFFGMLIAGFATVKVKTVEFNNELNAIWTRLATIAREGNIFFYAWNVAVANIKAAWFGLWGYVKVAAKGIAYSFMHPVKTIRTVWTSSINGIKLSFAGLLTAGKMAFGGLVGVAKTAGRAIAGALRTVWVFAVIEAVTYAITKFIEWRQEATRLGEAIKDAQAEMNVDNMKQTGSIGSTIEELRKLKQELKEAGEAVDAFNSHDGEDRGGDWKKQADEMGRVAAEYEVQSKQSEYTRKEFVKQREEWEKLGNKIEAATLARHNDQKETKEEAREQDKLNEKIAKFNHLNNVIYNQLINRFNAQELVNKGIIDEQGNITNLAKAYDVLSAKTEALNMHRIGSELKAEEMSMTIKEITGYQKELEGYLERGYQYMSDEKRRKMMDPTTGYGSPAQLTSDIARQMLEALASGKSASNVDTSKVEKLISENTEFSRYVEVGDFEYRSTNIRDLIKYMKDSVDKGNKNISRVLEDFKTFAVEPDQLGLDGNGDTDGLDLDNGNNDKSRTDVSPEIIKRAKDAANDADKAVSSMLDSVKTILNRMFALAKDEDNIELQTELQRQIDNIEKRKDDLTSMLNKYYMGVIKDNPLVGFMSDEYLAKYVAEADKTGDQSIKDAIASIKLHREGWDGGDGTRMQSAAENAENAYKAIVLGGDLNTLADKTDEWRKKGGSGVEKGQGKPFIDDDKRKRGISELLEDRGVKADEYLLKASEKDAEQVRKFLEELIKLRPFDQLRSEMSKNVIELGLFDGLDDDEIFNRTNALFDAVQRATRVGSDRVVEELRQSGLFQAWNLTPQQEEIVLDRITSFSEKYQDVVRQQAQKIKKRLEESMSLNAMRSPLEQLFDQFNIQSSIKAQYNPQIQSAYKQKVDSAAQIQRLEALLAQRGKEVEAAEKADNSAQDKKREEIKALEALAAKLAAEGKKEELQQVQIDLADARADLHEMTTNLSDVTVTAKANWKKIQDQLEAARKAYDGSLTTLDGLFRNMARDITKGLADYNKEQQKLMSVAEYKEFAATYFERQKSHYSRQESAGWGGNVMGLTNSDTATFKAIQEQLRVARYEMAELERRKMSDLSAIQNGTGSQEKKLQAMQAKAAEYKIAEIENQKELNKLELEEIALREEMANKIYQNMQEYSNIVNEFTHSMITAGTMTRGEKNLEKAKFDFNESRGVGLTRQEYVTYKSDGSYETSWMTDREFAAEQRKIERQNAMADAATETLNKMGEKMSEDIMNAFQRSMNMRQVEKNEEEQAQTEILDAVRTRIDGQISQEQAFTEYYKNQLAARMEAFTTYISSIQAKVQQLAANGGNVSQQTATDVASNLAGAASELTSAGASAVMNTPSGESGGLLIQTDIDNTLGLYMQEQNQAIMDSANASLAEYKASAQKVFNETFEITKDTDKKITKDTTKMYHSMAQSMNLYGAAYSAVMNDNLSTTQKIAMFSLQAIGQMIMGLLSSALSQVGSDCATGLAGAIAKAFSQLGPIGGAAAIGGITAAIGAGLAVATKQIQKSKKEVAQVTGVSAGKLTTGMLTYATGRYNNEEELKKGRVTAGMMTFADGSTGYSRGQSYSVDGADGKSYNAKYAGSVSDMGTGLVRGTHFGIFSEVKPETVIDGDTTAIIHNKYPFLENAWLQVARTGSLNMQEMLGLDYAGIGRTIDTLSKSGAFSGIPRMGGFRIPTFADGRYPYDEQTLSVGDVEISPSMGRGAGAMESIQADIDSRNRLAAAIEAMVTQGVHANLSTKQLGKTSRFEQRNGIRGGLYNPKTK